MHQRLLGRQPLTRIHHQQAVHKIYALLRQLPCILFLNSLWLGHIWKFEANKPRILGKLLLLNWRECSHDLLNLEQLINFRFTRKQRLAVRQLAHDTANCPHVDLLRVPIP